MKKLWKIALLAVMAILMGTVTPLQVFASAKPIYISEIRMASAEDADDAKKELEDAGYTVLDNDLNPKTKEDFSFIGYKTTSDPKKAITDIKALKQDNGYAIFDSQEIMGALEGQALEDAIYLMQILEVFRENKASGQKLAVAVYDLFQHYKYSETVLLGDFLINPEVDANALTDLVLNSDTQMTGGLYQFLRAAIIPDSRETCFTRYAESDDTEIEVTGKLESKARVLLRTVKSFQSYVNDRLATCASDQAENGDNAEEFSATTLIVSTLISEINMGDKKLFDLVMNPEVTAEELYPLAFCMNDAEVQSLRFLGFALFVTVSSWGESELAEQVLKLDTAGETLDFWDGSAKQENARIAITNDLLQQMIVGNTDSFAQIVHSTENNYSIGATGLFLLATTVTAFLYVKSKAFLALTKAAEMASLEVTLYSSTAFPSMRCIDAFEKSFAMIKSCTTGGTVQGLSAGAAFGNFSKTSQNLIRKFSIDGIRALSGADTAALTAVRAATIGLTVSVVLTIVAIVVTLIFFVIDIVAYYSPDYSEFPAVILSEEELSDGTIAYVSYSAVMDGERVGDTNARQGRKWNALYTTVSDTMGVPLREGTLTASSDGATPEGMEPVALFGSFNAYDLNTNVYNHDASIYLYFSRVDESTLASVFAEYNTRFIAGGAAVLAAAAAAVIIAAKKKRERTPVRLTSSRGVKQ